MKEELRRMIDKFLLERRESSGGWAEVTPTDVEQLEEIIFGLINEKWETDPDGDYPISCMVVDKTRYELPAFEPTKYIHSSTKEDQPNILRGLNMNLQIAADRLDTAIRIFTDKRFEP